MARQVVNVGFVEKYNQMCDTVRKAKTTADMRTLLPKVKQFVTAYKGIDEEATKRVFDMFSAKLHDMVSENDVVFKSLQKRMDEVKSRVYDPTEYEKGKDYASATNTTLLQLMARLPKGKTSANSYAIANTINQNLNSVAGCRAVLELMKYPAYADMVDERQKQRAFEGSKTKAQRAFESARDTELKEVGESQAQVYNDGFHLRTIAKQTEAFTQPTVFGATE